MSQSIKLETGGGSGEGRPLSEEDLVQIGAALRDLRFGSVQIIVQDGVIVQIDRTEKRRLRQSKA